MALLLEFQEKIAVITRTNIIVAQDKLIQQLIGFKYLSQKAIQKKSLS